MAQELSKEELLDKIELKNSSTVIMKGIFEEARCKAACPAGVDVPRYVRLVSQGRFAEALEVIREKIPFPSVCAYVCPRFCEVKCRRAEVDEPVAINALKRFVVDKGSGAVTKGKVADKSTGKRVAIVGSGPAGLTAAYYLAKLCRHSVTVFETLPEPGGMMRVGISDYRLPKKMLDAEIEMIKSVGVDIKTNTRVESIGPLIEQGFDAIFVGIGAQRSVKLMMEGEESSGVVDGVSFLKEVNLGVKTKVGERVAVVGGGNVAVDAARVARRLGGKDVRIVYRRTSAEMPASPDQVEQALEEGIDILFLTVPSKIVRRRDGVLELEFIRMKLGQLDESGRRRPEPIPDSKSSSDFDTVIVAIGENTEIPSGFDLPLGKGDTIQVDPDMLATSRAGVFAGGDAVTGPATVIEAIAAGRRAAISIDKYLGGRGAIDEVLAPQETPVAESWEESILEIPRQQMPLLGSTERVKGFDVVEAGFTEEMAVREAKRCLRCDVTLPIVIDPAKCIECSLCQLVCSLVYQHECNPEKGRIINDLPKGIHYSTECIGGCSLCIKYCSTEAIAIANGAQKIE